MRFFIDYRKLNAVTVRDWYPIHRMDQFIKALGEATMLLTLEGNFIYWKVEVDKKDRNKKTFKSTHGLSRFIRIPLRMKNAPGTFQ